MVNGVDTLYKNNQFEFDLGNQNENNFVINSEAYQEEFQMDATFHEWDADDRLDTLYTEHDISNNVLYQNICERNDIENFEHNQHYELQLKNNDIRRRTIVCKHFELPETTKSKDSKKETTTKQIGVHGNEHKNHDLNQARYNFQKNIAFTKEMTDDQIKEATQGSAPKVIFTDTDPALISTIHDEFLTTNTLNCMFHIVQNIPLNLKNRLKDKYDEFIRDFFEVQQINFIMIFEYQ
ncbi:7502_t:CDS:2 [Gigaspora margarita]|uniref:7502_t:CDS:1 n=1 Tax=Gigaspora margarita TaxID=4874 RepID=A0ABN7UUJ0_GIGMA|nr:7502_t:CDS:2 [Gigaspora margarita]